MLLAALFCIQCTRSEAFRTNPLITDVSGRSAGGASAKELERLAREDHIALLKLALQAYRERYDDYTCTFIKQERLNGQLRPEQWIEVKYAEKPFSVAMRWTQNPPIGDRAVYVEGKYNGQMVVRPRGLLHKLIGSQMRAPDGPEAMANTLRPITSFGFRRMMESLLEVYEKARQRGEGSCRFLGCREVAGRRALALERLLPPRSDYPAKTTVWYLDTERLVPLALEGYDWDDQLICCYLFKDVAFNVGLAAEDFTPEANDMKLNK
ncbi:MAG: hypothetical protein AMJ81_01455 [Phycisphaerae bacterium SM23_33]|nr:MAG: hypothetical protein AMJ81_01455 [Phycisphaerae bacterium SM23_33]